MQRRFTTVTSTALITAVFAAKCVQATPEPRRIEVTASRFAFSPSEVTVSKKEPIVLVIKSTDVAHGIKFRDLGLDVKAAKGQTAELSFTPEKSGDFVGQCSVFCGFGHGGMKLILHVRE